MASTPFRLRRLLSSLASSFAFLALATGTARAQEETLLLQTPTVSDTHVVFSYAGDLWSVSREGGEARRLTSSSGVEGRPELSPDGQWIAFTGQYEGNSDVYVISIDGGMPRRLTWHPGVDLVCDWHPDGKHVLFQSRRASGPPVAKLFLASIDEGTPEQLDIPRVNHAAYNADASVIAYTPYRDAFGSWKRYRGGRTTTVWLYDTASHEVEVVPHVNASDTFPVWLDGVVYFASDRDGTMNLFRYQPGSQEVEQLTHFTDFHIRSLDAGGGVIAYEQEGALHLFDPATRTSQRLRIHVRSDGLAATPRWQDVKGHVRSASIAPNGKRAVFEARGEIVSLPREHGHPRNVTRSPGAHDRSPVYSTDGTRIAWFSDEGGEYELWIHDLRGDAEDRSFQLGEGGFFREPQWSPDDEHILFYDKTNRIAYVTLETGKVTEVATIQGSLGEVQPQARWAPDSKWIAFENTNPRTLYDHIALYELESGETTSVTDAFGYASNPAFGRDGKYLYFTASVELGPNLFGLDMTTSASRRPQGNIYVAVLQKDGENPLAPRSDEPFEEENEDDEKDDDDAEEGDAKDSDDDEESDDSDDEEKEDDEDEEVKLTIDLEGLDQRILALPLEEGSYSNLHGGKNGVLFVERKDGAPELASFDFEARERKTLKEDVSGFDVSADGKWILTFGKGAFHIAKADGKDAKKLPIDDVKVRVVPEDEWPQMLREVWRIQRDYFYDANMHGVDWVAMWDRWDDFLPHVKHRRELTVLIRELIGELSCGHQYTWGGETPDGPESVSVGLLGADYATAEGRHRIAHIYRGQNWNADLRAPLTVPGVDAREGDFLISVNGEEVTASDNLYQAFENTAGTNVQLELSANADGSDSRTMTVVPVANEASLRRLSWVEGNRERVKELSGGRLAYIYMPNTTDAGRHAFDRDFFSQTDKEGVVLDERYNGGGQAANYVIDVLSRRVMSYWRNREEWLAQSPFGVIEGPKVMIVNESAGSGGDWMPWIFQNTGLGPLVGTRTWGGLVGISGYPPLMDGGYVTAASFGVMDRNGNWAVENVGVSPDHEVIQWPAQVIAGRDPQLEKAVQLAMEALNEGKAARPASFQPPAAR